MQLVKTKSSLKESIKNLKNISLVPTMGNLHNGHMTLFRKAFSTNNELVISIFVNPIQFNEKSDFKNYPRTINKDLELIKKEFPDSIVFFPNENEIYKNQHPKKYQLDNIASDLCGKHRPGHFNGVINIIDILLKLVNPKSLFLGKKDYQQLCIIEKFCETEYPKLSIYSVDTIRDKNNLALSSRNNLLKNKDKASYLYKVLYLTSKKIKKVNDISIQIDLAKKQLINKSWQIDYIEVKTQKELKKPLKNDKNLIILAAVYFEEIRLIDNIEFCIE